MTEPAESWRDHVEQMLRTWRCSHLNEDGDRLALDDFMDQDSIEDLIDFVCDEWSAPAPVALTDEEERAAFEKWKSNDGQWPELLERYPNGDYNRCATVNAWEVWQARALLARTGEAK